MPSVVILGPYRAGTSLLSAVVQRLGFDFGPSEALLRGNQYNPLGYFERSDVNTLNTRLIESAGGTLCTPRSVVETSEAADRSSFEQMDLEWTRKTTRSAIKDPRFCITLTCWQQAGLVPGQTRLLVIERELEETIRSALEHPFVSAYCEHCPERVAAMQAAYLDGLIWHCKHWSGPMLRVAYHELLADPACVGRIADFLEIRSARLRRTARGLIGRKKALARLKRQLLWQRLKVGAGAFLEKLKAR